MLTHKERLQRRKEIAQSIECENLSVAAAAAKFEVGVQTVRGACIEFDVPPQMCELKFSSYHAIALRQKGTTYEQIAKQLNVSHQRIQKIVSSAKSAGVLGLDIVAKKKSD